MLCGTQNVCLRKKESPTNLPPCPNLITSIEGRLESRNFRRPCKALCFAWLLSSASDTLRASHRLVDGMVTRAQQQQNAGDHATTLSIIVVDERPLDKGQ